MGIPGMLLGVPLAASAYRLLRDEVSARIDGDADRSGCPFGGNVDRSGCLSGGDAKSAFSRQTKEKTEDPSGAERPEQGTGRHKRF